MAFGFDDFAVAVGLTGLAKEVLWPLLKGSLEDYTKDFLGLHWEYGEISEYESN